MADEVGQDRTEQATPRRREEARRQGQVAFSPDLGGSLLLLAGIVGLLLLGPGMGRSFLDLIRGELANAFRPELGTVEAQELLSHLFFNYVGMLGVFLVLLAALAFFANVLQVGFHITPDRLAPDFEKLNPAAGFGKLFSMAALVKGLFALLKVVVLAVLVYFVLRSQAGVFSALSKGGIAYAAGQGWALTVRLGLYLASAFVILGVADYVYQRLRFEKSLRMTRQEVKEELRTEEGDPQIKARRRQMHKENMRRRMLTEVPRATAVITNPTHLAVAIRYDRTTMKAPRVLAKGAGVLAQRIVEIARNHAVPVIERAPLARALYRSADFEREIPPQLFQAVAEVLVFIYRLRGERRPV